MDDKIGIDWEQVRREQQYVNRDRRGREYVSKRYSSHVCLYCGRLIYESAYSGQDGNFSKHVAACPMAPEKGAERED